MNTPAEVLSLESWFRSEFPSVRVELIRPYQKLSGETTPWSLDVDFKSPNRLTINFHDRVPNWNIYRDGTLYGAYAEVEDVRNTVRFLTSEKECSADNFPEALCWEGGDKNGEPFSPPPADAVYAMTNNGPKWKTVGELLALTKSAFAKNDVGNKSDQPSSEMGPVVVDVGVGTKKFTEHIQDKIHSILSLPTGGVCDLVWGPDTEFVTTDIDFAAEKKRLDREHFLSHLKFGEKVVGVEELVTHQVVAGRFFDRRDGMVLLVCGGQLRFVEEEKVFFLTARLLWKSPV